MLEGSNPSWPANSLRFFNIAAMNGTIYKKLRRPNELYPMMNRCKYRPHSHLVAENVSYPSDCPLFGYYYLDYDS